jgi:hypothetical protein
MQPSLLRFTLTADGESLVLGLPPTGWSEFSSDWKFDREMFGFSVKNNTGSGGLRFVTEGADFLRRQLDLHGINAEIDFLVERRLENWTYEVSFSGRVDFAGGYTNERDFFEVKIFEGGLKQAYSQFQKTNYELPLAAPEAVEIMVPKGMQLYNKVSYGSFFDAIRAAQLPNYATSPVHDLKLYFTMNDGSVVQSNCIIFQSQDEEHPFMRITRLPSGDPIDVTISFYVRIYLYGISHAVDRRVQFVIREYRSDGYEMMHNIHTIDDSAGSAGAAEFRFRFTRVFSLNSTYEYSYELGLFYQSVGTTPRDDIEAGMAMSVSFFGETNTGVFSFRAFRAESVADQLIKHIYAPASCVIPFLQVMEQQEMQLFLTCGDGIRGVEKAAIKTNFEDFFKNLGCLYDIGSVVSNAQNLYRIEDKAAVLNRWTPLLDLGEVKNMQLHFLDDEWLANTITVGYEKQEYDYALGRQDFAATLEFTNDLNIPNKKLDLVSKYRADYTGVHLLHYDYANSDKRDSSSDNDVFWILAFRNGGVWQAVRGFDTWVYEGEENAEATPEWEAMEGGGYFNVLLSPHRNLSRHNAYFWSILDKLSPLLRFVSSTETLSNMVSSGSSGYPVVEKSDEYVAIDGPLFKPLVFEFECVVPKNLSEYLGENPNGYFTFRYNNLELKGFPIEITGSYTDSSQTVRCLAHPDTPDNIHEILHKRLGNRLYV